MIRLHKISHSKWSSYSAYYAYFLKGPVAKLAYSIASIVIFFLILCFYIVNLERVGTKFWLLFQVDGFVEIIFLLLVTFFSIAFVLFPMMLRKYYSEEYLIDDKMVSFKTKKMSGFELLFTLDKVSKVIVYTGVILDVWYSNRFGVRDSVRFYGLDIKEEKEILEIIKKYNPKICISNKMF